MTALGRLAAALAQRDAATPLPHPVLAGPGWWQRDLRLIVEPHGAVAALPARGAPLLVVGAGALARAIARLCHMRGLPYELLAPEDPALADARALARALAARAPWAVIHAAGDEDVDAAEHDLAHWRLNAEAPGALARACARAGVRLLAFSSDLVFPGREGGHYVERDAVAPLNAYGRAKVHAERAVLAHAPDALVIRSAGLFGPWDDGNFVTRGTALLRRGRPWPAAHDQVLSPTYAPDLVQAALDLLIDGERGVWHLTHGQALSWAQLACRAAEHARLDTGGIVFSRGVELGQVAPRPGCSALRSERGMLLPSLDDALARWQLDHEPVPAEPLPLRSAA